MEQLSLFEQVKKLQADKQVLKVDTSSLTKVYYTITEVAAMFGVNASLLRFWEKEFMTFIGQVKKNKKGDRYYNVQDIEKLKVLYHLIKERK
ncbi:MAG TPA: MerR family transcriptional regulator, partial [Chitinophagaceae bacterium]|nr:MerR family transcriptional regulator [Chitinophagaceae bacterium]